MVTYSRRGGRAGRRCLGHAISSPQEVGQQEASRRYNTLQNCSWVDATCAWRSSLVVSDDP